MKKKLIATMILAATVAATAACGTSETAAPATSSAATTTPLSATFESVDRLRAQAAAEQGFAFVWAEPENGACGRIWLRSPNGAAVNVDARALVGNGGAGADLGTGAMLLWTCGKPTPGVPSPEPPAFRAGARDAGDAEKAAAKGRAYMWTTDAGGCQDAHVTVAGATYTFPYQWIADVRTAPAGGRAITADRSVDRLDFCTANR